VNATTCAGRCRVACLDRSAPPRKHNCLFLVVAIPFFKNIIGQAYTIGGASVGHLEYYPSDAICPAGALWDPSSRLCVSGVAPCAAFVEATTASGADGFNFLSSNWGSASPAYGSNGNRCVGIPISSIRAEARDAATGTPAIQTRWMAATRNPFYVGNDLAQYTHGPNRIGINVRSALAQSQVAGSMCVVTGNGVTQGSGLCLSDGINYQSICGQFARCRATVLYSD
jgi:hypothetical protein